VTPNESNATVQARPRPAPAGPPLRALPSRDVRRKRPPALAFMLRLGTLLRLARVVSLLALDFAAVYLGLFTALYLKVLITGDGDAAFAYHQTTAVVGFAYLLVVLVFAKSDLYADRPRRPGFARQASSLTQVAVLALIFALATDQHFSSYYTFYGSLFFATFYVGLFRYGHLRLSRSLLAMAGHRRRAVLVGSSERLAQVAAALGEDSHSPVEVVGRVALNGSHGKFAPGLAEIDDLTQLLSRERVQEVIITDPEFSQERAVELVDQCHQRGVTVHVAPSTVEILIRRAEFVPGQSVPLFTLKPPVVEGFDFAVKRSFDVVVASLLLIVLSPLLAAIALVVKLTSRGPVLFRSERPGMGGEPFACLKFRTMLSGAERAQADLEKLNEASGPLFKIRSDPRLTSVGGLLRRFSLDELPQLWNVLRGTMSLVGPRPLPLRDFEMLDDWHKKRYLVLPGITGLWQISGRAELDFDDLVRLDFLYLERWSVFLDLTILLKTVPAVLLRRGAY
jgi:exopolysaccharide biosynthesis polyprenyl glycosylphosphotransferase